MHRIRPGCGTDMLDLGGVREILLPYGSRVESRSEAVLAACW